MGRVRRHDGASILRGELLEYPNLIVCEKRNSFSIAAGVTGRFVGLEVEENSWCPAPERCSVADGAA